MNLRESVYAALSKSSKGMSLLAVPYQFFSYVADLCDETDELILLEQTFDTGLIDFFNEASEYRSSAALRDAVTKARAFLVEKHLRDAAVSQRLCDQLAGGIADYLGIAYQETEISPRADDGVIITPPEPIDPINTGQPDDNGGWTNNPDSQQGYPPQGDPPKPPQRQLTGDRGSLAALIVAGIAILAALTYFVLGRISVPAQQAVPDVVGISLKKARSTINDTDYFEVGEVTKKYSRKVDKNKIISQTPEAGTEAEQGTAIDLVVSKGPKSSHSVADSKAGNVLEQANFDRDGDMLYYRLYTTSYASHLVARNLTTGESTPIYAITEDQSNHGLYNVLVGGNRVYFGIGTDTNGDERYDYGTICSVNKDGSDFQEICTQDTYGTFMKFYLMDNRLYYYRGGYVCSNSLTGDDERQEALVQDTEFFCMDGSLYLALADRTSFARVEGGERVPAWTTERWDDFTPAESCLIVQTRTSGGNALRWYDYATGEEVGYAELPTGGADLKGINSYGDDAVVIMQADSSSRTCAVYRTSPSGESSELWRGAGYALVWRPTVLGDRVFFNVVANESSHDTPCSVSVGGGGFRVEDSIIDHPEL